MIERWDFAPASAAEFPNDNPSLHHGVSWVCLSLGGPLRPVARPRRSAPPAPAPAETVALASTMPEAGAACEGAMPEPAAPDDAPPFSLAPRMLVELARLRRAPLLLDPARSDPMPPAEVAEVIATLDAGPAAAIIEAVATLDTRPAAAIIEAVAVVETEPPAAIIEAVDVDGGLPATPVPPAVRLEILEPLDLELTPSPAMEVDVEKRRQASAPVSPDARPLELDLIDGNADDPGTGFVVASDPGEELAPAPARHEPAALAAAPAGVPVPTNGVADGYAAFVHALVQVALGAGATRAAACLPLLLDESGDLAALGDEARADLVLAGVLDSAGPALVRTSDFASTAVAWRRVLREETNDLSACGTSTLDGWGVDLLRALGVGRDGRTDVRRELRRRGVAAFGILAAA